MKEVQSEEQRGKETDRKISAEPQRMWVNIKRDSSYVTGVIQGEEKDIGAESVP